MSKELCLGLTSIHWSPSLICMYKSYTMVHYVINTRSHGQNTFFFNVLLCCITTIHNKVLQDISVILFTTPTPPPTPPTFVVYCCGPVRLRSKHTWSLPLAWTLLLLHLNPFHSCWTFLWCLKSFYCYLSLIQFVCFCHQKYDYSFHSMQQWNYTNSLAMFLWTVFFFFTNVCIYIYITDGFAFQHDPWGLLIMHEVRAELKMDMWNVLRGW